MKDTKKWFILWSVVYLCFLILNLFMEKSVPITVLKYGGLLSCFFFLLKHSKKDYYLIAAMLMTLISDAILVFNEKSVLGVAFFVAVQYMHRLRFIMPRISSSYYSSRFPHLGPFLATMPVIGLSFFVLFVGLMCRFDLIYIVAAMYLFLLLGNIYDATKSYLKTKSRFAKFTMIGFILFGICDAFVALSFATSVFELPFLVFRVANYLAWTFYFPSQVMIVYGNSLR